MFNVKPPQTSFNYERLLLEPLRCPPSPSGMHIDICTTEGTHLNSDMNQHIGLTESTHGNSDMKSTYTYQNSDNITIMKST